MRNKYVTAIFESKSCLEKAKSDLLYDDFSDKNLTSFTKNNGAESNLVNASRMIATKEKKFYNHMLLGFFSLLAGLIGLYLFQPIADISINLFIFFLFVSGAFVIGHQLIISTFKQSLIKPYQRVLKVEVKHPKQILKAKKILFKHNAIHIMTEVFAH